MEYIEEAYLNVLGRPADDPGKRSYMTQYKKVWSTVHELEAILKKSQEYKNRLKSIQFTEQNIQNIPLGMSKGFKDTVDMIPLTVVITNWKRLGFLKSCVKSVIDSGIPHIVITCCETSDKTMDYLQSLPKTVKITYISNDLGCNRLWLNGLYQVKTEYVIVLHDDDELNPTLWKKSLDEVCNILSQKPSMVLWDGIIKENGQVTKEYHTNSNYPEGWIPSKDFLGQYIKGLYPLSPVVQIMQTSVCIEALNECDHWFKESKYYSKPTMMLGNEITMTCRNLITRKRAYYFKRGMTLYGRHPDSESEIYMQNGSDSLRRGYKAARDYLKNTLYKPQESSGQMIHVVNMYLPKENNDVRRHKEAFRTWMREYEKGTLIPKFIYDDEFKRNSSHVGDKRSMPFIKDIIDMSMTNLKYNDIVVLTNADICLATDAHKHIREGVERDGCCFSFRYDSYKPISSKDMKASDIEKHFTWYVGSDLFAFTKVWWEKHGHLFPDLIIGKPNWDWVMRSLMGWSIMGTRVFKETLDTMGDKASAGSIIYHEKHDSYAEHHDVYMSDPANVWCWMNAKKWFDKMAPGITVDGTDIFKGVEPYTSQVSPWYTTRSS